MKKLSRLLSVLNTEEVIGSTDKEIRMITPDSRRVQQGAVFVAVRGTNVDGHSFIPVVSTSGVAAIVCEELPQFMESSITYVKVPNSAVALGFLASEWYDNPSRKLNLVGVTGTNGKTTTATLIYEMARLMGYKAGLLSTVKNYVDSEAFATEQTTPDPLTINRLLSQMVEAGCKYAAMEVSSHACDQHRIAGLHFAGGIFSNLTRDHLDYHKTVDAYLKAKKSFFDDLPSSAFALVNADDSAGKVMIQNTGAKTYTYSMRGEADFRGRIIESRLDGTLLELNGREVEVMFTGRFNAYNLTAVYGASCLLGWSIDDIMRNMSLLMPVSGRFQTLRSPRGYMAVVDYAHTPDAIVNVLSAIHEVVAPDRQVITVVGAGGNRDKGKRPLMAQEAARLSTRVILTSDNPRFEEPAAIIADMEAGLGSEDRPKTLSIVDRREAIRTAAALAGPGDVVLIAGKGHEDYQEICGVKHHFDDRETVLEVFEGEKPRN